MSVLLYVILMHGKSLYPSEKNHILIDLTEQKKLSNKIQKFLTRTFKNILCHKKVRTHVAIEKKRLFIEILSCKL